MLCCRHAGAHAARPSPTPDASFLEAYRAGLVGGTLPRRRSAVRRQVSAVDALNLKSPPPQGKVFADLIRGRNTPPSPTLRAHAYSVRPHFVLRLNILRANTLSAALRAVTNRLCNFTLQQLCKLSDGCAILCAAAVQVLRSCAILLKLTVVWL